MRNVDVVIVGAGAAGLGAYKGLEESGLSVLLVEARSRIGGRALTRCVGEKIAFDVGCEWLHSADTNVFVQIAKQLQYEIGEAPPHWGEQTFDVNFSRDEQRQFRVASDAFYERLELAAERPYDSVASDCLEPGNRWNPLIDAVSSYVNGTELRRASAHDLNSYTDSFLDWRVRQGYGALIAAHGKGCRVALDTEVRSIAHGGHEIELDTSRGTLRARRLVYTLPTSLTAEEAVRFLPDLPDKTAAAAGLPLGHAEKVLLAIDRPEIFPEEGHLFGRIDRAATGSYDLRPLGQPCIEAFFGGSLACELEAAGQLASFAIDELVAVLGSDFRKQVRPLAASSWARDPHAKGSYSHALPGHRQDRATLAAPVAGRLFFAGEATSQKLFSTAHGAYETGLRAAGEVAHSMTIAHGVALKKEKLR